MSNSAKGTASAKGSALAKDSAKKAAQDGEAKAASKRVKHPERRAPTGFSLPDRREATEFWVVRHGESEWNASGQYQGQTDVPLSLLGRLQVETLAERLRGHCFDAVYSSDLERAVKTAEPVAALLAGQAEVQLEPRLREIAVGSLAGLTGPMMAEQYPDYLAALRQDPWVTRRPGGGESMEMLFKRGKAAFDCLRGRHAGGRVLVFTHGGMVRVALGLALGGAEAGQQIWSRLSVTNTSITRVLLGEGSGALLGFNDDAHLERLLEATQGDDVVNR